MTDDIVARLPTDAAARRLPEFIKMLRINRAARRESVYASDNVYALLDALDTAEARVRELEAENKKVVATFTEAADIIRRQKEWQTYSERLEREADVAMADEIQEQRGKNSLLRDRVRELEAHLAETQGQRRQWQEASVRDRAALAEAYERAADKADELSGCSNGYIATVLRDLAQEVKHEAE